MKTAKRKAEVGEKIIIVNKSCAYEPYKVGDIFMVQRREDFELIRTEEGEFIFDEEYEVILEDENEQY